MNVPFILGVMGILGCIYVWIGTQSSKNLYTNDDYFLMGRNLTSIPLMFTLLATQLGGGTLLGAAHEAYQKGFIVLLYPLGASLGLCLLAMGFGKKLSEYRVSTVAQVLEKAYESSFFRIIASSLSIITLFCILTAQAIAAKSFFYSIGFLNPIIIIVVWTLVVVYTVMGGLKAVINTDILQAIFMLAVLGLAFITANKAQVNIKSFTPFSTTQEIPWMSWFFMPLLFMLIEQDTAQRCFAVKEGKMIAKASIGAAFLLLLGSSIAIFFGITANCLNIDIPANSNPLIVVIQTLTNEYISSLFLVAILMAIISTADTLLCSIVSNISCDFIENTAYSHQTKLRLSKVFTLVIGLLALILAFNLSSIVSLLIFAYELSIYVLFIPTLLAIISPSPNRLASYCSMGIGAIGFITCMFKAPIIPKELLCIGISAISYFLVTYKKTALI